jgi:hypothetical protein
MSIARRGLERDNSLLLQTTVSVLECYTLSVEKISNSCTNSSATSSTKGRSGVRDDASIVH